MKLLSITNLLRVALFLSPLIFTTAYAEECSDRNAMESAMDASEGIMQGDSFKRPRVLKRHHPSKRKEVATYFQSGDLYFTLYWLVSGDCEAGFIKRTQGKY